MPSLLSCFCVRHHRHNFAKRKRDSRKKILSGAADWISETGSDHYNGTGYARDASSAQPPQNEKSEDDDIMNKLLGMQQGPRRRHIEDIFPETSIKVRHNKKKSLYKYTTPASAESDDKMYGYVPRAVGAMSASTALAGEKFDDFFHDCRLHPALDKFAKSSDFQGQSVNMFPGESNQRRVSIVRLGVREDLFSEQSPMELRSEGRHFGGKMGGSVSSASPSPMSSDEFIGTPDSHQHSFLNNDHSVTMDFNSGYNSLCIDDQIGSRYSTSIPRDPVGPKYNTPYAQGLENMFHCDGDVLY